MPNGSAHFDEQLDLYKHNYDEWFEFYRFRPLVETANSISLAPDSGSIPLAAGALLVRQGALARVVEIFSARGAIWEKRRERRSRIMEGYPELLDGSFQCMLCAPTAAISHSSCA